MNDDANTNLDAPNAPPTGYNALEGTSIHEHTRAALEDMAHKGLPLPHAAKLHGLRPDNLERAFRRPKVRKAYNQLLKAIRDNAAQAAYMRINHLSMTSKSEQVRLKANEWVAGVDGISKVQKVEGRHQHSHTFGGFDYGTPDTIDGTVADSQSPADDD